MQKKPEIIVFAGPNGSGKSTVTKLAKIIEPYINADDIKRSLNCSDLEAAQKATEMREKCVAEQKSFTFETVVSTRRNLDLLVKAKANGFFIRCIYVLTANPKINALRVKSRALAGGHDVPEEKVFSRYEKALALLPELIQVCDICHIYDNTTEAFRIFKKRKDKFFFWKNEFWPLSKIEQLTGIKMKQIHVSAAVIVRPKVSTGSITTKQVFATQRGYGEFKDWWEFPGGKIEEGESPEDALKREIREELATEISVGEKIATIEYDYPTFHLTMECFLCHVVSGKLTLLEHENAKWLSASELKSVKWLPADIEILDKIAQHLK